MPQWSKTDDAQELGAGDCPRRTGIARAARGLFELGAITTAGRPDDSALCEAAVPEEGELMTIGPGKYDDVCTAARVAAGAEVALVIIINGNKGSGFSMQGDAKALITSGTVADLLEAVAAELRRDLGPAKQ